MSRVWRCHNHSQRLRIDDEVVRYFLGNRQFDDKDAEAGGQLFGTVSDVEVRVLKATGPYPRDSRSRYAYRSDAVSAQRAIKREAKNGLFYLGEWHTHPEDIPDPSGEDLATVNALRLRSRLNTSSILLIVVGLADIPDGLSVSSHAASGRLDWHSGGHSHVRKSSLVAGFVNKLMFGGGRRKWRSR